MIKDKRFRRQRKRGIFPNRHRILVLSKQGKISLLTKVQHGAAAGGQTDKVVAFGREDHRFRSVYRLLTSSLIS